MERLALDADALCTLTETRVFSTFFANDNLKKTSLGAFFGAAHFRNEGEFFWRHVLRELAHSLGMGALSEKAARVFLARLKGVKGHKKCRNQTYF